MNGKRKTIVVVAAVAVVGVIVAFVWPKEKEPEYEGKKLSEWLAKGYSQEDEAGGKEAVYAVRQIGTSAVPYLLQRVGYRRPGWRTDLLRKGTNVPFLWAQTRLAAVATVGDKRAYEAEFGFRALGTNAAVAVPALGELMQNTNKTVRSRAMRALASIGKEGLPPLMAAFRDESYPGRAPAIYFIAELYKKSNDARSVIPLLLASLKDKDPDVVRDAARGMPVADFALTVPALLEATKHSNSSVRRVAILSLEQFGVFAKPDAVPALVVALQDRDTDVREAATNALEQIAPEMLTNGVGEAHE